MSPVFSCRAHRHASGLYRCVWGRYRTATNGLRRSDTISNVELRDTRNKSRTAATQDFSGPKRQETQYNIYTTINLRYPPALPCPALPCSLLRSPNNDNNEKHKEETPVISGIVAGHHAAQESESEPEPEAARDQEETPGEVRDTLEETRGRPRAAPRQ